MTGKKRIATLKPFRKHQLPNFPKTLGQIAAESANKTNNRNLKCQQLCAKVLLHTVAGFASTGQFQMLRLKADLLAGLTVGTLHLGQRFGVQIKEVRNAEFADLGMSFGV